MNKQEKWDEDVMVRISREVRAKLKIKAIKVGMTLKDYLKQVAEKK